MNIKQFFKRAPWRVLMTYRYNGVWFCVQVRMKRNGFKVFRVRSVTSAFHIASNDISVDQINALLPSE